MPELFTSLLRANKNTEISLKNISRHAPDLISVQWQTIIVICGISVYSFPFPVPRALLVWKKQKNKFITAWFTVYTVP